MLSGRCKIRAVLPVLTFLAVPILQSGERKPAFPVPEGIRGQIRFWVDVYTKYHIYERILHDSDHPERIYRVIDLRDHFPGGQAPESRKQKLIRQEKARVAAILRKLASWKGKEKDLTAEERKIYRLFGPRVKKKELSRAAGRIRCQGGGRENFYDSLIRSGRYLKEIRRIMDIHGLPAELAWLPHVESSFYPYARSHSGAVGLWQLTGSTAKSLLTIRKDVDERRDPLLATEAAARILKDNYRALKSWPLAVTAYNHGLTGMRRAVRQCKTRDLGRIIRNYRRRNFGFASKNFYAEFLAAVRVAENAENYFGSIPWDDPWSVWSMKTTRPVCVDSILVTFNISEDLLKSFNPALKKPVYGGKRCIPAGYLLRLPLSDPVFPDGSLAQNGTLEGDSEDSPGRQPGHPLLTRLGRVIRDAVLNIARVEKQRQLAVSAGPDERRRDVAAEKSDARLENQPDTVPDSPAAGGWENELNLRRLLDLQGSDLTVLPHETLGHYADWLGIPTNRLRKINGLRFRQKIRVGQKLRMVFSSVSRDRFLEKRRAYHNGIGREFQDTFDLIGSRIHRIQKGETLWAVASLRYDIPLWILLACNEESDLRNMRPGDVVNVPVLERKKPERQQIPSSAGEE
jgi:membrane-bound lytic murein transglycosylase D